MCCPLFFNGSGLGGVELCQTGNKSAVISQKNDEIDQIHLGLSKSEPTPVLSWRSSHKDKQSFNCEISFKAASERTENAPLHQGYFLHTAVLQQCCCCGEEDRIIMSHTLCVSDGNHNLRFKSKKPLL